MRILLTTPCLPRQDKSPLILVPPMVPLGIGFIAAFLENKGHDVRIIDNYFYREEYIWEMVFFRRNLLKELKTYKPDFVGIYTDSITFQQALKLIRLIKDNSKAKIVCGGPHASLMPESFPQDVDFVVQGEGEVAFLDILEGKIRERLVNCRPMDNIEGLPMPAWHLYKLRKYIFHRYDVLQEIPFINLNTSRGCPFRCSFCSVSSVWGTKYRMFTADKIVDEIDYLVKEYRIKAIYFREDNFTADKERTKRFCDLLIKKNLHINWACETRVDTIDEGLMRHMKEAGCAGFYVGVESGSQKMLNKMAKGVTVEEIKTFFKNCHTLDIKTKASFMFGVPGEEEKDRAETEDMIARIKPTYTAKGVYVGIPKSELYEYLLKNKLYYYKDENNFLYPFGYRELATRYYKNYTRFFIP